MTEASRAALHERTDAIEQAYEFMLAYAARGRERDDSADPEADIRPYLQGARDALDGMVEAVLEHLKALGADSQPWRSYLEVVAADAARARTALALVLAQTVIGSELVDNLNASIHLRSLLTDIFLIDSLLEPHAKQ